MTLVLALILWVPAAYLMGRNLLIHNFGLQRGKERTVQDEQFRNKPNHEQTAWKWMRYSGLLLIPLVWFHVLIQDVLAGVHQIDLD